MAKCGAQPSGWTGKVICQLDAGHKPPHRWEDEDAIVTWRPLDVKSKSDPEPPTFREFMEEYEGDFPERVRLKQEEWAEIFKRLIEMIERTESG